MVTVQPPPRHSGRECRNLPCHGWQKQRGLNAYQGCTGRGTVRAQHPNYHYHHTQSTVSTTLAIALGTLQSPMQFPGTKSTSTDDNAVAGL